MARILECSSKGDKRFSAFYAKVSLFGKYDTIENHYQQSKLFFDENWKFQKVENPKGMKPAAIIVNNVFMNVNCLTPFYKFLWLKYLDNNPELVEVLRRYDEYMDMFKGKNTLNCQADVIRQYMKIGRDSLIEDIQPFLDQLSMQYICLMGEWTLSHRLYTLGYSSLGANGSYALEKLKRVLNKYDAILVDIRLNPKSGYYKVFDYDNLERLGLPYIWVKSLGNVNYKGGPYVLKNEFEGLRRLKNMLQFDGRNVILFCAEKDPRNCHRRYIARMLLDSKHIIHLV